MALAPTSAAAQKTIDPTAPAKTTGKSAGQKLNNKELRELEALPAQIEALEKEQAELAGKLSDASFYHRERGAVSTAEARLAQIEREHATAFARWEELEAIRASNA